MKLGKIYFVVRFLTKKLQAIKTYKRDTGFAPIKKENLSKKTSAENEDLHKAGATSCDSAIVKTREQSTINIGKNHQKIKSLSLCRITQS